MTVENLEDLYQDTEKHAKELGITIVWKEMFRKIQHTEFCLTVQFVSA